MRNRILLSLGYLAALAIMLFLPIAKTSQGMISFQEIFNPNTLFFHLLPIAAFICLIFAIYWSLAGKHMLAVIEALAALTIMVLFAVFVEMEIFLEEPVSWQAADFNIWLSLIPVYALLLSIGYSLREWWRGRPFQDFYWHVPNPFGSKKRSKLTSEELLRSEEGHHKKTGYEGLLIFLIAVGWSIFQLLIASTWVLPTAIYRAVHLGFAMTLVFLVFPAVKFPKYKRKNGISISWFNWVFARVAGITCAYLVANYIEISESQRLANNADIAMAFICILFLFEGVRRSLGLALAVIGSVCLFYAMTGPRGFIDFINLPDLIAHKGHVIDRVANQMYVTSEGIFGVALGVSAQFVFLFVLFGAILDKSGAGKYFIDVANAFLGGLRGGPAKASIVASGLTGMVSGSSLANTVTTGTFTIPLMKRTGYPPHKAAATEVAVSTNGQIMPPVMGAAAFLIAEYVGIKYFDVVRAAIIPAFIALIALFYVVHLEARKLGIRGLSKEDRPPRWRTFISGIQFLFPLGVLVYYLVVARVSPGFAVVWAIMALFVIIVAQNLAWAANQDKSPIEGLNRGLAVIFEGLEAGARGMIGIALAVAAAGIVVGTVNFTGLGLRLAEIIESLGKSIATGVMVLVNPVLDFINWFTLQISTVPFVDITTNISSYIVSNYVQFTIILILVAIASLILGLGLPTTANYIVMATLTAPIIVGVGDSFGFDIPLIAAHMFVFFFGILADDTPPVGLAAYAAAAIARTDPIKTGIQGFLYDIRTAILPFIFIFDAGLLLIGVDSWTVGIWIFVSALAGMLVFVAAIRKFALRPLAWYQVIILLIATFCLITPSINAGIVGFILAGIVYVFQFLKSKRVGTWEPPESVTATA